MTDEERKELQEQLKREIAARQEAEIEIKFDFYDSNGQWLDSCKAEELMQMAALLTVLFGEVTIV